MVWLVSISVLDQQVGSSDCYSLLLGKHSGSHKMNYFAYVGSLSSYHGVPASV